MSDWLTWDKKVQKFWLTTIFKSCPAAWPLWPLNAPWQQKVLASIVHTYLCKTAQYRCMKSWKAWCEQRLKCLNFRKGQTWPQSFFVETKLRLSLIQAFVDCYQSTWFSKNYFYHVSGLRFKAAKLLKCIVLGKYVHIRNWTAFIIQKLVVSYDVVSSVWQAMPGMPNMLPFTINCMYT
jgi:hypothetical protein